MVMRRLVFALAGAGWLLTACDDGGIQEPARIPGQDSDPKAPAPAMTAWEEAGPYSSKVVEDAGPDERFTLWVPQPLGKDGAKHPVIVWGNGVGTTPRVYGELFAHWASHGMLVVAANSINVAGTEDLPNGMKWAIGENSKSGSEFFDQLQADRIASVGYSNGAIASVNAGARNPEVTTTINIAGGSTTITQIHHPLLLIGNEFDIFSEFMPMQFLATPAPVVYGVSLGTSHMETMGDGGVHRGITTAWLKLHLQDDLAAYRVFYGDENCSMCTDAAWETQRRNTP